MRLIRIIPLLALLLVMAACVYRQDIPQGNQLTEEDIESVEVGMSRSQVRFLLGSPQLETPLHPDRWLYHFYVDSQRDERSGENHLAIYFDDQGQVREIRTEGPDENGA